MRKLLAAYYSISGSSWGIGRGNETTAVPSSELLNLLLKNYLLYSASCTLINIFLLLKGKTLSDTKCRFSGLKITSKQGKTNRGIWRGTEGLILKRREQIPETSQTNRKVQDICML